MMDFLQMYEQGRLNKLASSEEGMRFLLMRSIARKDLLIKACAFLGVAANTDKTTDLWAGLQQNQPSIDSLKEFIAKEYTDVRKLASESEQRLVSELFKLRVFDWGGIHQNDINKHLVDKYIKKIESYDVLIKRFDEEIVPSVRGFILCSWYNNWTSILIENMFKDHPRVLPTLGKIKQVDFFIDEVPFDLKVTYFPKQYLEERRAAKGLPRTELSELKRTAKKLGIPFDNLREPQELQIDILTAMSESGDSQVQAELLAFKKTRKLILNETAADSNNLIRWLYENQGAQRFDASNRIFLILADLANIEDSWKLKRDVKLLEHQINAFLDEKTLATNMKWSLGGEEYESIAGALFLYKN